MQRTLWWQETDPWLAGCGGNVGGHEGEASTRKSAWGGVRETFISLTVVMVSRVYTYVKAKKLYTLKCVDYWLYLLESTAWWSCDCGVAVDCIIGVHHGFSSRRKWLGSVPADLSWSQFVFGCLSGCFMKVWANYGMGAEAFLCLSAWFCGCI